MKRAKVNIVGINRMRWEGAGKFNWDESVMMQSGGEQKDESLDFRSELQI